MKKLKVAFAERCAWRAIYISRLLPSGSWYQFFHLGIDPNHDAKGPKCFGAFYLPWAREGKRHWGFRWRFTLPHQPWNSFSVQRRWRIGLWAYRLSSNFYFGLDGRFKKNSTGRRVLR